MVTQSEFIFSRLIYQKQQRDDVNETRVLFSSRLNLKLRRESQCSSDVNPFSQSSETVFPVVCLAKV